MKRIFTTAALALCISFAMLAQSISPMVVASGGGSGTPASGYMSYTIGQTMLIGGTGQGISSGFQQNWGIDTTQNKDVYLERVSAIATQPGQAVTFKGTVVVAYTNNFKWSFVGIKTKDSINTGSLQPSFTVTEPGMYLAYFSAEITAGTWKKSAPMLFTVLGITQNDTTVCLGRQIALQTNAKSNFVWENGSSDPVYKVTATKSAWHKITIEGKIVDSVYIGVFKTVSLGNDTSICAGKAVSYNFNGIFDACKWNGNNTIELQKSFTTAGLISVIATDANGCKSKDTINIKQVFSLPTVNIGANDSICPSITKVLDAGAGFTSYLWQNGSSLQTCKVTTSGNYSVTISDANGCKNADTVVYVVKQPFAEPLGVSTFSENGKHIILAWERTKGKGTVTYKVLREYDQDKYSIIGNIPFANDSSVFKDKSSNAIEQAFKYKLRTINACGDSAESEPHRTMFVQTNYNVQTDVLNLNWNRYEGLPLSKYLVYEIKSNGDTSSIGTVPASKDVQAFGFAITSPKNKAIYRVAYNTPQTNPTRLKADSGPFSMSLSNMAESKFTNSEINNNDEVTVSPNPAKAYAIVSVKNQQAFSAQLVDILGRTVISKTGIGSLKFDCSELHSGVYFVKIICNDILTTKELVVE